MATQRPPSGMGRPMSRSGSVVPGTGRLPTAVRAPPTAIRVGTGMVPGTGSHTGMRASLPPAIKVTDRPVTQQGLSGMKTAIKGPQRQILDKSYYLGLLRSKITELSTETSKLHREMDTYNQENSVYLSYEKKAEGLAAEIKDLRGQLADLNLLVDKLNTNTEMEEMTNDYNILKNQNDNEAESIDSIFTERREREEAVRSIEERIRRERSRADEVINTMPQSKQEKYFTMTAANEELLQALSVLHEELDVLISRKEDYEAEMIHSHMKQEAVRLHRIITEMEAKRDALLDEDKRMCSPEEEREKLFQQVKEDNQEIASMDRQISELRDRSRQVSEDIRHVDQDSEAAQGETQQKYKELKKKEEEIDRFLGSFDESKAEEDLKMSQCEENIVSLLELCSRNMVRLSQVDSVTANELRSMQEVLISKETEVFQSESTTKGLSAELQRLQQDLEKVQLLEGKITGERSSLKERLRSMESELMTYRDLDLLKTTAQNRKERLEEDLVSLSQRGETFKHLLDQENQRYEDLRRKLEENETHVELTNLERKWQHLEQNNFVMREFIASKSQESDYASVAKHVYEQLLAHNRSLIEALLNKT
ncbi:intraflagellar transport protein 74 homolog [Gouania willdenowi]|uniref:intraflagellar transport protein 74 homolog n=1 Tax=Gouania willdenowi TaxID=441366 RepID=UPI00105551CE|nr:intraflagellar transport protein 74 homolog [Gouania willdenowi]XP_028290797.1 intraflagellar transport protein 74 homolog [Gouania willdenowi]